MLAANGRLDGLGGDAAGRGERLEAIDAALARSNGSLQSLGADAALARERLEAMDASFDRLDAQLRDLGSRFAALEARLGALDAALGETREAARGTLQTAQKLDASIADARKRLEGAEAATITNCYEIAQMKRRL